MRVLRLLIWDALLCIILTISYAASAAVVTPTMQYCIALATCVVCGIFLAQLPQRADLLLIIFITIPAIYVALAPLLFPLLDWLANVFSLPFSLHLVPAILLSRKTQTLRYACALIAAFTLLRSRR